jgi:hypothetical protein
MNMLAQVAPDQTPEQAMAANPALVVIVFVAAVLLVGGILYARRLDRNR